MLATLPFRRFSPAPGRPSSTLGTATCGQASPRPARTSCQRHSVGASLMWRFAETTAPGGPHSGRPDWSASYVYSRWRPAFYVAATDTTSFLALASPGSGVPEAELREQNVAAGVQLPVRHVRHQQLWQAEFDVERETRTWMGAPTRWYRNALPRAWTVNTALTYGRSISAEDGVSVGVTSEQVRTAFGADGDADAFTAEARGYWRPGRSHAVLAARAGYGTVERRLHRQAIVLPGRHVVGRQPRELRKRRARHGPRLRRRGGGGQPHCVGDGRMAAAVVAPSARGRHLADLPQDRTCRRVRGRGPRVDRRSFPRTA